MSTQTTPQKQTPEDALRAANTRFYSAFESLDLAQMEAVDAELAAAGPELAGMRRALADGLSVLRQGTGWIMSHGLAEPNDALAGAMPYLRMFGLVVGGWLLARSALAAGTAAASPWIQVTAVLPSLDRATSREAAAGSTPVTLRPVPASAMARHPVPQPTSSTRSAPSSPAMAT